MKCETPPGPTKSGGRFLCVAGDENPTIDIDGDTTSINGQILAATALPHQLSMITGQPVGVVNYGHRTKGLWVFILW